MNFSVTKFPADAALGVNTAAPQMSAVCVAGSYATPVDHEPVCPVVAARSSIQAVSPPNAVAANAAKTTAARGAAGMRCKAP